MKNAKKYLLEIGKWIIIYIFSAIYMYYNVDVDKPFVWAAVIFLLSIIFVHIIIHFEENKKNSIVLINDTFFSSNYQKLESIRIYFLYNKIVI